MKLRCSNCGRDLEETNFYTYKDGKKTEMCKQCMTLHIDNFNPDSFLWLLQKMDVPYVPAEWNVLRDRAYNRDPKRMNGMSVFGKYLAKMRLKKWKDYTWADSQALQQKVEETSAIQAEYDKIQADVVRKQFENGEISQAQYLTLTDSAYKHEHEAPPPKNTEEDLIGADNSFNQNNFLSQDELPNLDSNLTHDDKIYLAMKWGRLYKPQQWIQLEKLYNEMMESFDIHDADTKKTLILICKLDLKMNHAIDSGDIQSFQKLSKASDTLRKSANFTAAQNKTDKDKVINSASQIVAFCQKQGGQIPRWKIDTPLDIIDKVIKDMKNYTKNLVYEDSALAKEIQDYLKRRQVLQQQHRDRMIAQMKGLSQVQITDQDIVQYKEDINIQKQLDKHTMREGE